MSLALPLLLLSLLLASCVDLAVDGAGLESCVDVNCPAGEFCQAGSCVPVCQPSGCDLEPRRCGDQLPDGCGGTTSCACLGEESCIDGLCCLRGCTATDCGNPDGCGGSCDRGCLRWERLDAGEGPRAREAAAAAFDPERGVLVMFGGSLGSLTFLGDTWELHPTGERDPAGLPVLAWSLVDEPGDERPRPSPRETRMAYLPGVGTVLAGGQNEEGIQGELWRWHPETRSWELLGDAPQLSRRHHGLVLDERRGVLVMFGGESCEQGSCSFPDRCSPVNDVWELGPDLAWSQPGLCTMEVLPGGTPGARNRFGIGWDGRSERVIVRGGVVPPAGPGGSDRVTDGAWAWDGASWAPLPDDGLGPLRDPAMAWDPLSRTVVLHGGFASHYADDQPSRKTMEWTGDAGPGGSWSRSPLESSAEPPEPRERAIFTGGEALGGLVFFGGSYLGVHDDAFRVVRPGVGP